MSANEMQHHTNMTCSFCGLACDDIKIDVKGMQVIPDDNLPEFCKAHYRTASLEKKPDCLIEGKKATLDEAINHTAHLLQESKNPLLYGMCVDVQGAKDALQLADTCGATIDHINSTHSIKNSRVMQDEGWILGTFSEVINRAETIVIFGNRPITHFPRLVERLTHKQSLYRTQEPEFVMLGSWQDQPLPDGIKKYPHRSIIVEPEQLSGSIQRLSKAVVQLTSKRSHPDIQAEGSAGAIPRLAKKLLQCRYSTIIWSATEFDMPYASLVMETLSKTIKRINTQTRCVAFPLGGSLGDANFHQVATWQSGFHSRISFAQGFPEYNPIRYDGQRLLKEKETDFLLWVSSLEAKAPPLKFQPCAVIGHPALPYQDWMSVYIPVGIPGIDHRGYIFRTDTVVSLPLKKARDCGLPSASHVLQKLNNIISSKQ